MLMLRWAFVISYLTATHQKWRSFTPSLTIWASFLVGFPQVVAEHPWEALPPEVAEVLRPERRPCRRDRCRAEPRSARLRAPARGPFGKALRSGVEEALGRFTTMVENPGADPDAGREVYLNLGRGEMRAGRSMDALLAAYRLGARVAWRRLAAAGEEAGLHPHTLYALAERSLRTSTSSPPTRSRATRASRRPRPGLQRRRQRLAALLVPGAAGRPPPSRRPRRTPPGGCRAAWPRSWSRPRAAVSRPTGSLCGWGRRRS